MHQMSQNNDAIRVNAMRSLVCSVLSGVAAGGAHGAPSGVLFAAMQAQGATLSQYGKLMTALAEQKLLVSQHDVVHLTDLGHATLARMNQMH